jgi:hypothetical protein
MGSARLAIRTVSGWATMVKGLSNSTNPALQMKPVVVHFGLAMALKQIPKGLSMLLLISRGI